MYEALIVRPVRALYLKPLSASLETMNDSERRAVFDQAVIGWLQTVLLIVVIVQVIFAGLLRLLTPELRTALGFLHRIEWAAYLAMLLVGLQAVRGYAYHLILTNRFYAFGWRFGKMQIIRDARLRVLITAYGIVSVLMVAAILYVRVNGFIVQPK